MSALQTRRHVTKSAHETAIALAERRKSARDLPAGGHGVPRDLRKSLDLVRDGESVAARGRGEPRAEQCEAREILAEPVVQVAADAPPLLVARQLNYSQLARFWHRAWL